MDYKYDFQFSIMKYGSDDIDWSPTPFNGVSTKFVKVLVNGEELIIDFSKRFFPILDHLNKLRQEVQSDYSFDMDEAWVMAQIRKNADRFYLKDYDCEIAHKYTCHNNLPHWKECRGDQNKIRKIHSILKSHGVALNISGCGCCGSPVVHIKVDGETIVDEEGFCVEMIQD